MIDSANSLAFLMQSPEASIRKRALHSGTLPFIL